MDCDREGTFKAEITDYGMREQESGAIAITVKARLNFIWNQDAQDWEPWSEYQMDAYGDLYVVKKDGKLNHGQVQSLMNHAGWDGNFASVVDRTWEPTPCQVVIQPNEYKGNTTYRISFINDLERTPGQMGTLDPDKAKALQARFGGELRALAGNTKRNGDTPAGKPPAPPSMKQKVNNRNPYPDPNLDDDVNRKLQEAGASRQAGDDDPFA